MPASSHKEESAASACVVLSYTCLQARLLASGWQAGCLPCVFFSSLRFKRDDLLFCVVPTSNRSNTPLAVYMWKKSSLHTSTKHDDVGMHTM